MVASQCSAAPRQSMLCAVCRDRLHGSRFWRRYWHLLEDQAPVCSCLGWMGLEGRQVSSYGRNQQVLRREKMSCWAHSRVRGEVVRNYLRGALQKVLAPVKKNFCKLFALKNCCYTHDGTKTGLKGGLVSNRGTKTELKWGLVSSRYWWNLRLQKVLPKHMQPSILPSLLQPPKILNVSILPRLNP